MLIPKYWTRVTVDGYWALGWSDVSMEDAQRCGRERAGRIAARIAGGITVPGDYPYPNRPVREQVIERDDAAGWAITRNCYGALVLNTAKVMFVDIDLPTSEGGGLIGRLFGRKQPDPSLTIIERTRQVVSAMNGMGARLYRTAGGFRLLVTSETYDPTSDLTHDLLQTFGTDQRYATLCKVQECFRARLTPKPWRCNARRPSVTFPFDDERQAHRHAAWVSEYDRASRNFSVCQYVESIGNRAIAPAVESVLQLHDDYSCRNSSAGLA